MQVNFLDKLDKSYRNLRKRADKIESWIEQQNMEILGQSEHLVKKRSSESTKYLLRTFQAEQSDPLHSEGWILLYTPMLYFRV